MSLPPGSRLGPYEIVAALGAGGMGEVYRARDSRLGREVAVKVLPGDLSTDEDRVRRFEQEARSASALDHPNIITIYDIGSADSTLYIAMQYVEGKTLRELLSSGPLTTKKVLEISVQIAEGLAKAHAAGIIHRDLKPENVMVSKDGFVKILDFGLAKLTAPLSEEQVSELPTAMADTRPGMVMGTVGYMSPEQASGKALDFRSDQFSFGSILYELSTGKRAFQRNTTAETLTAIIREEPEPVGAVNPKAPAPLRWIVERCLAKDPDERFGTTRDLARDIASIRDHLSDAIVVSGEAQAVAPAARRMRLWPILLGAAGLLAATALVSFSLGRNAGKTQPPSFRQLTFRRGTISSARFAPDGQTVVYGTSLEGRPTEIFVSRPESPESRPFGMPGASVLAISKSGEMALSLGQHVVGPFMEIGTLARMSVAGGAAPREILENVQWADWAPDGATLAIVREAGGRSRLEYPIGKVLYETPGWISHPRVSHRGDEVAYIDHPARGDDGGSVVLVDRSGKRRNLSESFETAQGLAWAPEGGEVWFTAAKSGSNRALYAVTLSGRQRLLARVPGTLTLHDVSSAGRAVMTRDINRQEALGRSAGEQKERDLSWLDWTNTSDISDDGKTLLFSEAGEGGGAGYSAYVRGMDGSPAVRLGEGSTQALSPDGKYALAITKVASEPQVVVYSTGAGETRTLPREGLLTQTAHWLPNERQILLTASEAGHGSRLYLRELSGGKPRAISPEGYRSFPRGVSPDGKLVAVRGPDQRLYLYPVAGGEPSPIPGLTPEDNPTAWSADGRFLYVYRRRELPAKVYRLEVATGRKELWRELMPFDTAGVVSITPPKIAPDGRSYAYSYVRTLSDLYLVEGLR
jgi:Tol biopolymer transport system component/predicted Ser/Thr protein kinase